MEKQRCEMEQAAQRAAALASEASAAQLHHELQHQAEVLKANASEERTQALSDQRTHLEVGRLVRGAGPHLFP